MKCKNTLADFAPAYLEKNPVLTTRYAGQNVGLDLEKPIDCSKMDVRQMTNEPVFEVVSQFEISSFSFGLSIS